MKIAVVGAGAIGGWLAARLALAGQDVSVLARGAALARIRSHGLELRSGGESHAVRLPAAADAAELGPQDAVFITVKAPALPALAPALQALMHDGTTVLTAGNGLPWWYFMPPGVACQGLALRSVDPQGQTAHAIPWQRVLGLSVFASCQCPEPGVVQHSAGKRVVLGEPAGGSSDRVQALAACLQDAGLEVQRSDNIRRDIWTKLLGNACLNPVSFLTGAASDDMIDDPRLYALFVRMMDEAIAVGGRLGMVLEVDAVQRLAQSRKLGHIKTSMLQDLEAGRVVEIDAILGSLVEAAAAVAMPVPMLDAVLGMARLRAHTAGLVPQ